MDKEEESRQKEKESDITKELEDHVRVLIEKEEQRKKRAMVQKRGSTKSIHEEEDEQSDGYDDAVRQFLLDININDKQVAQVHKQHDNYLSAAKTLKNMAYSDPRI